MPTFKIYKFTRPNRREYRGEIDASSVPAARKAAIQEWPDLQPSKRYPLGRAIVEPPPGESTFSEEERRAVQTFIDRLMGNSQ